MKFRIYRSPEAPDVSGGGEVRAEIQPPADAAHHEVSEDQAKRAGLGKRKWLVPTLSVLGAVAFIIFVISVTNRPPESNTEQSAVADSSAQVEEVATKDLGDSLITAIAQVKTTDSLKAVAAAKITADSSKAVEVAKANKKTVDSTTVAAKPATTTSAAKDSTIKTAADIAPKKGPLAKKVDEIMETVTAQGQRIEGLDKQVKTLDGRVGKLETTTVQLVATTDFLVLREAVRYSQAKNGGETVQADIDAFKAATISGREALMKALSK